MSSVPDVSVITPTRNRRDLLGETMDSVANQGFQAWEHLVIDDGSTDGTAEAVERRACTDDRVRYFRLPDGKRGANACRNVGIAQSRADLLVFLDSDDLLQPDCLGRRVEVMKRNQDLDFATFQTGVFERVPGDLGRQFDPDLTGDHLLRFLYSECPWQTTAPVWRRTTLQRLGGFDEALPSWQDVDLHVRALASGCRYLRFPEVDHHMRWQTDPGKVSAQKLSSAEHLRAAAELVAKFEGVLNAGPGLTWTRQRALCSLYFILSELWVDAGQPWAARRCWRQIRTRRLGPRWLYLSGLGLLGVRALGPYGRRCGRRIAHKWKGWARMRTNPELT